jgi:NAD(P)H-hydrate epimerase
VLSGAVGALLAKHMEPFEAVCAAVVGHAAAGRWAAAERGAEGVIASDVIEALPQGLRPLG